MVSKLVEGVNVGAGARLRERHTGDQKNEEWGGVSPGEGQAIMYGLPGVSRLRTRRGRVRGRLAEALPHRETDGSIWLITIWPHSWHPWKRLPLSDHSGSLLPDIPPDISLPRVTGVA